MGVVPRQRFKVGKLHYGRPQDNTFVDDGICESLLLSMPHRRLRNGSWSGGGPFFQVTDEIRHYDGRTFPGYTRIIWRDPQDAVGVVGVSGKFVIPDLKAYKSNWTTLQASAWAYVPAGYRATRPGNPIASLGQFLVELRDLPKIPFIQGRASYTSVFKQGFSLSRAMHELRNFALTSRRSWGKLVSLGFSPVRIMEAVRMRGRENLRPDKLFPGVGGEYLNWIFGWKPFISDIRKAYALWNTIDKQMANLVRNNGKGQRRRAKLLDRKTVDSSTTRSYPYPGANVNGFPGDYINAGGQTSYSVTTTTKEKVWYAAKYRYYIPDVSSSQWKRRAKLALFGALPTPELVWELTPFSWLIDWAVNVQDVASNMSTNAVDNLVQLYSYTMRSIETETEAIANTSWRDLGPIRAGSHQFRSVKRQTIQTRTGGGSPYALNAVSGTDLSPYQVGVLAALGLSLGNT